MNTVSHVEHIWDTGITTPYDMDGDDVYEFKEKTKSSRVIGVQWQYGGIVYKLDSYLYLLPDFSGFIDCGDGCKTWTVLNGDNTIRCVVGVPRVRDESVIETGYLGWPTEDNRHFFPERDAIYGEGSDGFADNCRFFFDSVTFEFLRVDFVGSGW